MSLVVLDFFNALFTVEKRLGDLFTNTDRKSVLVLINKASSWMTLAIRYCKMNIPLKTSR